MLVGNGRSMDMIVGAELDALDSGKFADEAKVVATLLEAAPLNATARRAVVAKAATLVNGARRSARKQGVVESFLKEFSLGTREGLALMCLAEALLRTPDADTRDRLIAEKISMADWASHLGKSDSLFVNASTWGLMLTGKLVDVDDEAKRDAGGYLKRLSARAGEPVIRQAVAAAVRIMGEQFVLGRTIGEALKRAKREKMLCSFDMHKSMQMPLTKLAALAPFLNQRVPVQKRDTASRSSSLHSVPAMKPCKKSAFGKNFTPVSKISP
jgi:RHH-type transcriptional regulator, proline utilization regulon repressor / proline dehydrogenase / delta 1-pyrroline-5-carboxylate dehydrogenase